MQNMTKLVAIYLLISASVAGSSPKRAAGLRLSTKVMDNGQPYVLDPDGGFQFLRSRVRNTLKTWKKNQACVVYIWEASDKTRLARMMALVFVEGRASEGIFFRVNQSCREPIRALTEKNERAMIASGEVVFKRLEQADTRLTSLGSIFTDLHFCPLPDPQLLNRIDQLHAAWSTHFVVENMDTSLQIINPAMSVHVEKALMQVFAAVDMIANDDKQ